MKKIFLMTTMSVSLLFSAIDLQSASKDELVCIKGIGDKKADQIIKFRESHTITSPDDLLEIKGFGEKLIEKIKKEELTAKCIKKMKTNSN